MKKMLALLLCLCIACPFGFAGIGVQAAETETVLFESNFENDAIGDNIPTKANTVNMWTERTESRTSTIKIAEDTAQGRVAYFSNTSTTSGTPRLLKTFYFDETMTNMTVSYKIKTQSANVGLYLRFADVNNQLFLNQSSEGTWADCKVELNFATKKYVTYVNEVKNAEGDIGYNNISTLQLRFASSQEAGKAAYLDDVRVTTTSPVDVEECNNINIAFRTQEEIMEPYLSYPHAPATSVPTGKYLMFTYDCTLNASNGIGSGTDALWTRDSGASQAVLNADTSNNGKIIRMTNNTKITQTPYLQKKLAVGTEVQELTTEYYAVLSDSAMYVELRDKDNNILVTSEDAVVSETSQGAVADSWNKIKATFDIQNQRLNVYVNDTLAVSDLAFKAAMPEDTYEVSVYVYGKLLTSDTILLDNFVMYQDAEPKLTNVKYYGITGTTWSLVATDTVPTDNSLVNKLRQHPRLMINDRAALVEQINSDPQSQAWYTSLKAAADKALTADLYTYNYGNGRNILDVARGIGERLEQLGFAYLVEQDEKYVERGIEELRNASTFPDWSNNVPIIPSEIMLGFACFYDWCYNSPTMTAEIKTELMDIIKKQALWQFVRSYDGVINVEIANGKSNRTTVANSAAGLLALAVADEYPQLAQYLIDRALECMQEPTNAYATDGAYPEGVSYWSYPMRTITPFLSSMQSAVVEGYTLPDAAQWYFDNEALKNTLDYWAYGSGTTGKFDFGDSSSDLDATSVIFWHAQKNNTPFHSWYAKHILAKTSTDADRPYFSIPWYNPSFESYNSGMPLDKTFNASDTAQIASMRSSWTANDALYAAMQGGDNATGHMFKSLGTFVIDANGKRFIRTIGRSNYSANYPTYMYYNERAEGQNTLIANPGEGFDQVTTAVARFIDHGEAENEAYTVLDMTQTNADFADAKRGMFMTKGRNSVILQDEVTMNFPSELWWFAHTDAVISLVENGKGALLNVGGEKMFVKIIAGPEDAVFTVMDALPLSTSPTAPDETYRNFRKLAIHMTNVSEMTLAVEFIPIEKGETVPTQFSEVKPIGEWSVSDNTISVARQAGYAIALMENSPNALVLEEKKLIDASNTNIVPVLQSGKYMVPAKFVADSIFAKSTVSESSVSVTRNGATNTVTSGLTTINGVVYAPADKLAAALGMQLYTDTENGLIVFSDTAVNYGAATNAAIAKELKTRVYIDGKDFAAFTTDRDTYYIPYNNAKPKVSVSDAATVTKTADASSFTLDGKTYTFNYIENTTEFARDNVLGGVIPTVNTALHRDHPALEMTDGSASTYCATQSRTLTDVTYTLELGALTIIESFKLYDKRDAAGSVMETATFTGKNAAGEWIELGTMANLEEGTLRGGVRVNELKIDCPEPVNAICMCVRSTDGYTERYSINELEAIGYRYVSPNVQTSTETVYAVAGENWKFTTNVTGGAAKSGYLIVVLYKDGAQCGVEITSYNGEESVESLLPNVEFDEAQVMLLESFFTMRILAAPEVL